MITPHQILQSQAGEPWLITANGLRAFAHIDASALEAAERFHALAGSSPPPTARAGIDDAGSFIIQSAAEKQAAALDLQMEDFFKLRPRSRIDAETGIAHIAVHQVLTSGLPKAYAKLGLTTDYGDLRAELASFQEQGAEAYLFHIDSPGGMVLGNVEAAEAIAQITEPTAAFISGYGTSAAYKLAAGTDHISAAPSARVGSIGTVLAYVDSGNYWSAQGIEFKAITNEGADLKGTFYENHLSPAQLENLQADVDAAGRQFHAHVTAHRTLAPEVFRAGHYAGQQVLALGLADALAPDASAAEAFLKQRIG